MSIKTFLSRLGKKASDQSDNVEQEIAKQPYIPEPRLWRRMVMAQMFQLLHHRRHDTPLSAENYDACVKRRTNAYVWRMTANEFEQQSCLRNGDPEQYAERVRWFNGNVLREMAGQIVQSNKRAKALSVIGNAETPEEFAKAAQKLTKLRITGRKPAA